MAKLIITADDYGYGRRYDEGILAAAEAGAIDAVSSFSARPGIEPGPLLASGVEIGLHLDLGAGSDAPRAGEEDRRMADEAIREQLEAFRHLYGRMPAYLDGHHHGHAREGLGVLVCDIAAAGKLPLRSVGPRHRRLLRCRGIRTSDRLVGRDDERKPVLPELLAPAGDAEPAADAVIEWVVHPGRSDPEHGSAYDTGREQDLALLLAWEPPAGIERATHAAFR